ncbi:hypothetical protein BIV57_21395 [Mangrovactinospora gilvigrisea]|uniref:Class F sortase n=1 Tax=Mangrovactinospora gilvigrisea TaxID=1428644 RepID=A0A1J7BPU8_9ACTN|nr:hypothetical protein BIV57_21395 [Mangrovactinospora gilvigrisea]
MKRAGWGLAGVLAAGAALLVLGQLPAVTGGGAPSSARAAAVEAGRGDGAPDFAPSGVAALPASRPTRLTVPSVGISAPIVPLGVAADGTPQVPPMTHPAEAGWLRGGPAPGAEGAAVVVGHVDTRTGPAVFWPLTAVRPGARVEVRRADGRTAVFTVHAVRVYPRDRFPSATVYGAARGAELRLLTCGGTFDRARGEYSANVVVFAHLTEVLG